MESNDHKLKPLKPWVKLNFFLRYFYRVRCLSFRKDNEHINFSVFKTECQVPPAYVVTDHAPAQGNMPVETTLRSDCRWKPLDGLFPSAAEANKVEQRKN